MKFIITLHCETDWNLEGILRASTKGRDSADTPCGCGAGT